MPKVGMSEITHRNLLPRSCWQLQIWVLNSATCIYIGEPQLNGTEAGHQKSDYMVETLEIIRNDEFLPLKKKDQISSSRSPHSTAPATQQGILDINLNLEHQAMSLHASSLHGHFLKVIYIQSYISRTSSSHRINFSGLLLRLKVKPSW